MSIWLSVGLVDTVSATYESLVREESHNASSNAEWPAWLVLELPIAGTLGALFVSAGMILLVRRLSSPSGEDSGNQPNCVTGQ